MGLRSFLRRMSEQAEARRAARRARFERQRAPKEYAFEVTLIGDDYPGRYRIRGDRVEIDMSIIDEMKKTHGVISSRNLVLKTVACDLARRGEASRSFLVSQYEDVSFVSRGYWEQHP